MSILYRESRGSTVKDCLASANNDERPSTPPEIRKYRRSAYLEPGKRFQHYGIASDLETMNLDGKIYGVKSDRGNGSVGDTLSSLKLTEAERLNRIKNEKIYKSTLHEPLGSRMDRKMVLPSKFTQENEPFGVKTKSISEPVKDILNPRETDESLVGEELYRRSHGSYAPGEQKTRNYNWPKDPNSVVFGQKGGTIAFNGASTNIEQVLKGSNNDNLLITSKSVEDFRNTSDFLGKSRNLGQDSGTRPIDMVYGQTSAAIFKTKAVHTAAEIMKGNYSVEDQLPDRDLGKSIMPGFRNVAEENRVFGCPSIRTDLSAVRQGRRSVADAQNYGDDLPAKNLINPPPFSDLSISPDAMKIPRTYDKLVEIFSKIGYDNIHPLVWSVIFEKAANGQQNASINAFRNVLNEYLDSIEVGKEEKWLAQYGVVIE